MHVCNRDFCLLTVFTLNICQCSGFIMFLSTSLFTFPVSSLCLSFTPTSMAHQQTTPRRGAWFVGVAAPDPPFLDRRRVERECHLPWEWALTPAGQEPICTLVPYQPSCKPVQAVGKAALRNHQYSML